MTRQVLASVPAAMSRLDHYCVLSVHTKGLFILPDPRISVIYFEKIMCEKWFLRMPTCQEWYHITFTDMSKKSKDGLHDIARMHVRPDEIVT